MLFELIVLLFIAVSLVLSQTTEPSNASCTESCDCPESQLQEFFGSLPELPPGNFLFSGFLTDMSPFQVSSFLAKLNEIDSFVGDVDLPDKKQRVYRNCVRGSITYNQYFMLPLNYPKELAYVCGSRAESNLVVMDLESRELLLLKNYNLQGVLKKKRCLEHFEINVNFTTVWNAGTKDTQKLIPRFSENMVNPTNPPAKNGENNQHNNMMTCLTILMFISSVV